MTDEGGPDERLHVQSDVSQLSENSSWHDRLGIDVPHEFILEAERLDSEDQFNNLQANGMVLSSRECATSSKNGSQSVQMLERRLSKTESNGSQENSLEELMEYLQLSTASQSIKSNENGSINSGVPENNLANDENSTWIKLEQWQEDRCKATEGDVPVSDYKNEDAVTTNHEDNEEEEDDCLEADEKEDDYFSQSPPEPRSSLHAKALTGNRRHQKIDSSHIRRIHVSNAAATVKKKRNHPGLNFSLPVYAVHNVVNGATTRIRQLQNRQRHKRRNRARGAKTSSQHDTYPSDDELEDSGVLDASSPQPSTYLSSSPPSVQFSKQCPDDWFGSLPQLPLTVKMSTHCRYLSVSSRRLSEPTPTVTPPNTPDTTTHADDSVAVCVSARINTLFRRGLGDGGHCVGGLGLASLGGVVDPFVPPSPGYGTATRKFSQEEILYQQELSETLWLELRAVLAQQDINTYDNCLYQERDKVHQVVSTVLNFTIPQHSRPVSCPDGCLSIWCTACRDHQDRALRQVRDLMRQIDKIENLFPSTQKIVILYPSWGGVEFVSRCKTLYLWYNSIVQLRQTITLLGHRLQHIASSNIPWPAFLPHKSVTSLSLSHSSSSDDDLSGSDESRDELAVPTSTHSSPVRLIVTGDSSHGQITSHTSKPSVRTSDNKGNSKGRRVLTTSASDGDLLSATKHGKVSGAVGDVTKHRFAATVRSNSSGGLLSPEQQVWEGGLKRSSSTTFLEENPFRKYVEKCMHSRGLRKTYDKIVEVIRDVMSRTVCLMEQRQQQHHCHHHLLQQQQPIKCYRALLEHCADLRRYLDLEENDTRNSTYQSDTSCTNNHNLFVNNFTAGNTTTRKLSTSSVSSKDGSVLPQLGRFLSADNDIPAGPPLISSMCQNSCSARLWMLGLPGLSSLFWFLASVPVQLVCECLRLRLSQMPEQPSHLSIRQLVREVHEGLRLAVSVRRKFDRWSNAMTEHLSPGQRRHGDTRSCKRRRIQSDSCCHRDVVANVRRRIQSDSSKHASVVMNFRGSSNSRKSSGASIMEGDDVTKEEIVSCENNSIGCDPRLSVVQNPVVDIGSLDITQYQEGNWQHHLLPVPSLALGSVSAPTSPYHHRLSDACSEVPTPAASPHHSKMLPLLGVPPQLSPLSPLPPSDHREVFFQAAILDAGVKETHANENSFSEFDDKIINESVSKERHFSLEGTIGLESPDLSESSADPGNCCVSPHTARASLALRREHSRRYTVMLEDLDKNIEKMLTVYLSWLHLYIPVAGFNSSSHFCSSSNNRSFLQDEWQFVCSICPQVLHAYTRAASTFCNLSHKLLTGAWDGLSDGIDKLKCRLQDETLHLPVGEGEESPVDVSWTSATPLPLSLDHSVRRRGRREQSRPEVRRLCEVVNICRRRMTRALGLARTLREQLEVGVQYRLRLLSQPRSGRRGGAIRSLLAALQQTGHVRLSQIDRRYAIFAPGYLAADMETIMVLLSLTPLPEDLTASSTSPVDALPNNSDNVTSGQPIPSLIITTPSSHAQPLMVLPAPSVPSKGSLAPPTTVNVSEHSSLGGGRNLAYLLVVRLKKEDEGIDGDSQGDNDDGGGSLEGVVTRRLGWTGPVLKVRPTAAVTIALAQLQDNCEVLAVCSSGSVTAVHGRLSVLLPQLAVVQEGTAPHTAVQQALVDLKEACVQMCDRLLQCVHVVTELLQLQPPKDAPHQPVLPSSSITRDAIQKLYNFAFEYHRDVCRLVMPSTSSTAVTSSPLHARLSLLLVSLSRSWASFTWHNHPPGSGEGRPPRWAAIGLEFVLHTCSSQYLRHLDKHDLQVFESEMVFCYQHLTCTARPPVDAPLTPPALTPGATRRFFRSSSSSVSGRSASDSSGYPSPSPSDRIASELPTSPPFDILLTCKGPRCDAVPSGARVHRVRAKVQDLEDRLQQQRVDRRQVGRVVTTRSSDDFDSSSAKHYKTVGFSWHRGFKIGSGQFGKVYTAVNNTTGELLAVKVQPFTTHDRKAVAKLVEELKILEGFTHDNLVKYYGIEVLEDELLLFMEFCEGGTLTQLSASTDEAGLPEELVRRYTRQLLDGVAALHDKGVIHRDIKGANIFLTQDNRSLKLGDFGCAARLRGDHTEVGELKGVVGTHAFMAPEIFQSSCGHGRAADVWSVACVVVEMSTGRRPWPECDNSMQVMFKVGMGKRPTLPSRLSDEGHDFLRRCFVHDPKERATASYLLLHHPFVKVELEDDCYSLPLNSDVYSYSHHHHQYQDLHHHQRHLDSSFGAG